MTDEPTHALGDARRVKAVLRAELRTALRARDRTATRALRSAIGAIENAEAVPAAGFSPTVGSSGDAPRRRLDRAELAGVLLEEVAERERAIGQYRRADRSDLAEELAAEAAVLRRHLAPPPPETDAD